MVKAAAEECQGLECITARKKGMDGQVVVLYPTSNPAEVARCAVILNKQPKTLGWAVLVRKHCNQAFLQQVVIRAELQFAKQTPLAKVLERFMEADGW